MRKNIRQTQTPEQTTKCLTNTTQNCEGHEKQGETRNSQTRRDYRDMTTKCSAVS